MGEEVEVRREDQDKINKFSRLHQRELSIQEELKAKQVRSGPRRLWSYSTVQLTLPPCRKKRRSSTTSTPSWSSPTRMILSRELLPD
jgi:hypothetical protein